MELTAGVRIKTGGVRSTVVKLSFFTEELFPLSTSDSHRYRS